MRLVLLVLLSLLSQQLGASVAGLLFDDVGASAMVALRVVFSAAVLLLVTRPSRAALAGLGPRGWAAVVGLGAAMTGMNLAIYETHAHSLGARRATPAPAGAGPLLPEDHRGARFRRPRGRGKHHADVR